jgi:hypothetical protein
MAALGRAGLQPCIQETLRDGLQPLRHSIKLSVGLKGVRENQKFCRRGGTNLPVLAAKRRKIKALGVSVGKKWETIKPRRAEDIVLMHTLKPTQTWTF